MKRHPQYDETTSYDILAIIEEKARTGMRYGQILYIINEKLKREAKVGDLFDIADSEFLDVLRQVFPNDSEKIIGS